LKSPLVTLCLPSLNTRPFLKERMDSLLAQSVQDWELIVCDSYSNDGSWEFFQLYKSDPRVKLFQVPREGIYAGWNECLRRATGRYIYMATSDDTAEPKLLETLLAPLERHPQIQVAVCQHQPIDEQSRPIEQPPLKSLEFLGDWYHRSSVRSGPAEFLLHACFGNVWVTMTAVLFRRSILDRTGLFRTDMGSLADMEWTMRAALTGDIAWFPEKLATWRIHSRQASAMKWTLAARKSIRDSLQAVLADPNSGIPPAWRTRPGWQAAIMHVAEAAYREKFELYRWVLRQEPGRFWQGFRAALRQEPGWLVKCALRGFGVGPELSVSSVAIMQQLLHTFPAAWPPKELSVYRPGNPAIDG
jgi:glycosyltransferase involved in cell wall biosynthesis